VSCEDAAQELVIEMAPIFGLHVPYPTAFCPWSGQLNFGRDYQAPILHSALLLFHAIIVMWCLFHALLMPVCSSPSTVCLQLEPRGCRIKPPCTGWQLCPLPSGMVNIVFLRLIPTCFLFLHRCLCPVSPNLVLWFLVLMLQRKWPVVSRSLFLAQISISPRALANLVKQSRVGAVIKSRGLHLAPYLLLL
jgi:hypothetical protein